MRQIFWNLSRDADLLIHECTFTEAFIEHRRKSKVGTFSHTSPADLGKLAVEAKVKALVATHIGHVRFAFDRAEARSQEAYAGRI